MSHACSRMHALLLMRAHFHIHLRLLQVRLLPYAVVICARVCVHFTTCTVDYTNRMLALHVATTRAFFMRLLHALFTCDCHMHLSDSLVKCT